MLEGRHEIEITSNGVVIHPRTEVQFAEPANRDRGEDRVRMAFGVPALDKMLYSGFYSGSMSTLYGAPGTGKTSLGLSFLTEGATRGEHGIYLGFYETPSRLLSKAKTLGLPMERFVKKGMIELQWQQSVENIPDAIAERLLERIREKRKRRIRVFIDGMSGFRRAMPYPERFAPFLAALTNELRTIGATTIYSEEAPLFSWAQALPDSELGSIVDNVIFMRYVESQSRLSRQISITGKGLVVAESSALQAVRAAKPAKKRV